MCITELSQCGLQLRRTRRQSQDTHGAPTGSSCVPVMEAEQEAAATAGMRLTEKLRSDSVNLFALDIFEDVVYVSIPNV